MGVMDMLEKSAKRHFAILALGAMATITAVGPANALEIKSSDVHAMGYPTTDAIQFMGEWLSAKDRWRAQHQHLPLDAARR